MAGSPAPTSARFSRNTGARRAAAQNKEPLLSDKARQKKTNNDQNTAAGKSRGVVCEPDVGTDTSIHVVVRCRGRNEREIKENRGVAVRTEGVKGKTVELSAGPNALSNKTYTFDKVFSAAADQATVYEEVVLPMVNEMLMGYNCTVFAYGQTGAGKTYTMSGDMTDTLGILSDNAGIIPRALYSVFDKLKGTESAVKCSFIELYNEGLRDLLSADDSASLKILENEKKSQSGSMIEVHGMEETYIDSASSGIKLLRLGSEKRQVAATKCNDLSSRSHTIFTITVHTKQTSKSGESYICSGKLNLVDLAGSENIQRSGAESKRATEAGLINKSLLTLGRVINALVDKAPHIPYRESKLTRLLQDSLGGRTKTCIIATISPCRSNLEETTSTLDYAFRAKNIRNKPQINSAVSRDKLIGELAMEIEKLKSNLIATRRRNGVYMTPEAYEELTMESESRRIINEEQSEKIKSIESSLQHKVQELLALTSNFNHLKQENENIRSDLDKSKDILEQTEIVLKETQKQLEKEKAAREAHQNTEKQLHVVGNNLLSTLHETVHDINGLHAKIERKSELERENRRRWQESSTEVCDIIEQVDVRLETFHQEHAKIVEDTSRKVREFLESNMRPVHAAVSQLHEFRVFLDNVEAGSKADISNAQNGVNGVFNELRALNENIRVKIGEGLLKLSATAQISQEVVGEFSKYNAQLRASYRALSNDIKTMFEKMKEHIEGQKAEIDELRRQLRDSHSQTTDAHQKASSSISELLEEERASAEAEREDLMRQIQQLLHQSHQRRLSSLTGRCDALRRDLVASDESLQRAAVRHNQHLDQWNSRNEEFAKDMTASKDDIQTKIETDCKDLDERDVSVQRAMDDMHQKMVHVANAEMEDVAKQTETLRDLITKAQSKNDQFHNAHMEGLSTLATDARKSSSTAQGHLDDFVGRVDVFQRDLIVQTETLGESTTVLQHNVRRPLSELQTNVRNRPFQEYKPTGVTPKKRAYKYPTVLPRTEEHDEHGHVRSAHPASRGSVSPAKGATERDRDRSLHNTTHPAWLGSPSQDAGRDNHTDPASSECTPSTLCLKEVDLNVPASARGGDGDECARTGRASEVPVPVPMPGPVPGPEMPSAIMDATPERNVKRRRTTCSTEVEIENVPEKVPSNHRKMMAKKVAAGLDRENSPSITIGSRRRLLRKHS
ncbi:hypothetical protein VTO42DRAFT_8719 [Malbranchea cinnamomea]